MATKRNNAANGDVIVERVLTSDAFLAREIKKAPLKTKNGSLTADLKHLPNDLKITIQGAREHNLKNVDLEFPRNRMVVFTGLSGSGKSSLAFDTLFAEGQRRYVESLSAYARQFLGQMDKPDVDFIEGLSPAVSIDQKTTNRNPRSTDLRLSEIAVCPHWHSALPGMRRVGQRTDAATDGGRVAAVSGAHTIPDSRAGRPWA